MDIGARIRQRVHARFEELMGPEMADAVMEMFPPAGWRGVATRDDLERMGAELRGEIARSEGRLRGEIGRLEGEIGRIQGEIGGLRGEIGGLEGEIGGLRGEISRCEGRLLDEIGGLRSMIGRVYVTNALSMVAVAGFVLAVAGRG